MSNISIIGIGTTILSVFLLFITIKQIGGLPGYTIYYPLIAGLAWIVVSPIIDPTILIMMTLTSTIARFIHKRISPKYLSLLLYPRQWLYVSISIFLLIMWWLALSQRNIINRSIDPLSVPYLGLAYAIILHITPKVFGQGKWVLSLSRWLHNIWFVLLSSISAIIMSSHYLIQWYSRHPWMIIVIILLCIIIGKYPWLQIMEMIRFRRIISQKKKKSHKYTT